MQTFLNDVEQAAVAAFYENEGMRESVKKVLLAALHQNGTLQPGKAAEPFTNTLLTFINNNKTASNEEVGAHLRAQWEGLLFLEGAFNHMQTFTKKVDTKTAKFNKAR